MKKIKVLFGKSDTSSVKNYDNPIRVDDGEDVFEVIEESVTVNGPKEPNMDFTKIGLQFIFEDGASVEHIIPVRALSLVSYRANRTVGNMSANEFVATYHQELNDISDTYTTLYNNMGLGVVERTISIKD